MSTKKDHLSWTIQMDDLFIEAMLQQKRERNKLDRAFSTFAYANMVKELNEKLPTIVFTKQNLKNRLKTLKKDFNICYDIFKGNSRFAWSPIPKLWSAEPEVWKELTAVCLIFLIFFIICMSPYLIYLILLM